MWVAPAWAAIPAVSSPIGSGWLLPWLDPTLARAAQVGVLLGAVLGLVGWHARAAFALVAACGFYLLAIPQFHGGVQHAHHLLWFAALLAVSPASDAWSVERWQPAPGRSLGWGLPTHTAWLVLAAIYFFPGMHKLRVQRLDWAGDNLTWLMYWKWAQNWDFTPLTRLDHTPTLLWLGGLAVLAFEVGAPLLVLHRWSRAAFAVLAGLFHLGTALWFDIHFWSLWICFVVMWPFQDAQDTEPSGPQPAATLMAAGLLLGIGLAGATATTQGWPFACYPTFEQPVGRWMPTIAVEGVDASGGVWPVPERALADARHSQSFYSEAWGLTGLYGSTQDAALAHFAARMRLRPAVQEALGPSVRLRLRSAQRSVEPGSSEVRLGEVLWEGAR